MTDSFKAKSTLDVGGQSYQFYDLRKLEPRFKLAGLPFAYKILLENLLRHEDGTHITPEDIEAVAGADLTNLPRRDIPFTPARVVLQDFTGVPCIVDFAAMRDAMRALGSDAKKINPLCPAELVIDHSVMVDHYGSANALDLNAKLEFQRNKERYAFLRWGQQAFDNFAVVPPDTGIVHQVNLEFLARVVFDQDGLAYPDTVVGTDSHTTMINGVGVLGWGVGGIEAEAAMLGQPVTMLMPEVIGFKLDGRLPEGSTATDLVLTVTQMLRAKGVVGKFVEFFGDGLAALPLADRATIANMAPEYGATCGLFPIDQETLRYLELTGRDPKRIALVEAYARAQGMWREDGEPEAQYTDTLSLDLSTVVPSLAGPKRPQDRVPLTQMRHTYQAELSRYLESKGAGNGAEARLEDEGGGTALAAHGTRISKVAMAGQAFELRDGAVVIAAITSCTNTSNPAVLICAGLLARNARERGLKVKPWVKTSLAPGSKVVTEYLQKAGLMDDLEALGFHVVGYGCTTCIGNSGPLHGEISKGIAEQDLVVASVLSGNRNFEGRVHPEVRMNFLASPPLVVAYALAGTIDVDLAGGGLGHDRHGNLVRLKDIWPSQKDIQDLIAKSLDAAMFTQSYGNVFEGDRNWSGLDVPGGDSFAWDEQSTYVRNPPYFEGITREAPGLPRIRGARCLALLGDSITTDHISPAGNINQHSPAGQYLVDNGVKPADFNSYGSRRGNHEVMMRGTFANIRLRNQLVPGVEGGYTRFLNGAAGDPEPIYDAAMRYAKDGTPLVVLAGKEYGTGSSRDWAAKGTILLGVRAVISESFERIHRSNLVGMGVLPLNFAEGESAATLGLDGTETFDIDGLERGATEVQVTASKDGDQKTFRARVRIDTPMEWDYFENGGVLHYMLRRLAS